MKRLFSLSVAALLFLQSGCAFGMLRKELDETEREKKEIMRKLDEFQVEDSCGLKKVPAKVKPENECTSKKIKQDSANKNIFGIRRDYFVDVASCVGGCLATVAVSGYVLSKVVQKDLQEYGSIERSPLIMCTLLPIWLHVFVYWPIVLGVKWSPQFRNKFFGESEEVQESEKIKVEEKR